MEYELNTMLYDDVTGNINFETCKVISELKHSGIFLTSFS